MQPVIIEDTQSIAANTTEDNVIALNNSLRGLLQAPFAARIRLLAVQSAAGLRVDALHGQKSYVQSSDVRVATFAEDPLDVLNEDAFTERGEIQVLRVTNTTGGALTFRYRLMMMPMDADGADVELPPDTIVMQRGPTSIADGTDDENVLDGLPQERVPVPSILRVLMTQSAIGMTRQLFVDQDRVAPPSAISIANRIPQDPFDSTIDGVEVDTNAQQQLLVSNNSGGALNVFWKIKNQQLVRT